jgi:hypothetical protein
MIYAILLLGLLPLALLPDFLSSGSDDPEPEPEAAGADEGQGDLLLEAGFGLAPAGPGDAANDGELPGDDETPGGSGGMGQAGGATLLPVDEADSPGTAPPPGGILPPLDEDDQPGEGAGGEVPLGPVIEIDSEAENIWLNVDEFAGASHAEVTRFEPGRDVLHIGFMEAPEGDGPELSVMPSEDGNDALVLVDGVLIAVLRNAAGATAEDVHLDYAAA